MSEDGQGWVWDELGQKLVGLKHRTPRASCNTTSLLSYRGNLSSGRKALRVHELDVELTWAATATASGMEGRTFTGLATVKFGGSEDGQDVVDVEVAVDPQCLNTLPEERQQLVKDVIYAVESMDAAIMVQLNDFLWNMEKRNRLHELDSNAVVAHTQVEEGPLPAPAGPTPAPMFPAPSFVPDMSPAFA
ncbi:hypothetical protein HYH02_001706 [Chlamydomonas schloesseri]|uniref:Activator of Hsp90 ATPase N-terminal domain-containing protein n=1 Tax=Chlamydomonas schloesseri TaxID=2026947 RepID=A0A836BC34_9CHLO|nr:hypothetical protein HYH02_001706 [Chlamydomonas schloesseri]|eukprot:KAG2453485.1 hypothetical protein HYH02_001706 [Chlamydomonas schloesseri]